MSGHPSGCPPPRGASVRVEVTVVHEVPAYRYGLVLGLRDAGFDAHEAASAEDLVAGDHWDACVLSMGTDDGCAVLDALVRTGGRPVVAVLPDPALADYRTALDHGAAGVVEHSAPLRQLVHAVKAALRGMTLLPTDVARALGDGLATMPAPPGLPDQGVEWLTQLARGASVAQIARKAGYSERQMYRRLQELYRAMGARNRTEAIGLAARWGLTTDPGADGGVLPSR